MRTLTENAPSYATVNAGSINSGMTRIAWKTMSDQLKNPIAITIMDMFDLDLRKMT